MTTLNMILMISVLAFNAYRLKLHLNKEIYMCRSSFIFAILTVIMLVISIVTTIMPLITAMLHASAMMTGIIAATIMSVMVVLIFIYVETKS